MMATLSHEVAFSNDSMVVTGVPVSTSKIPSIFQSLFSAVTAAALSARQVLMSLDKLENTY